jgi:pyruvate dehydrogenase E1 component alpha subunit
VNIEQPVDHLSILNEDGEVDTELAPDIPGDVLVKGLHTMLLARRFDERRLKLQRSGRIGTFAPVNGQEAAQVGTISALRSYDWFIPSYRETAANFWRGVDPAQMLVFDAGYNEGVSIPEDSRDLPNAVPVGTQMLQAAGIAYAARQFGTDEVAMTYFGDGATSQGDFHEALNFAAVFDCPVVFVCQNNQYAISVPREKQTRSATIAQKAVAYGMPGIQIDGNDILAAYVAASEAVKRAREESRPTLIECVTYRLEMHTTADDPTRYREDEEVEEWRSRDPIERFYAYLASNDLIDDAKRESMEDEIGDEIDEAWRKAQALIDDGPGPEQMFEHILAEKPPELERQQEMFAEIWKSQKKGDGDG